MVIVGAGPTGLTLANLLGGYGVPVLLVERNPTTVQEPRAVSIDDESLRTMQAAGLVERVLEHVVEGYGSVYVDPHGKVFLTVSPTEMTYGYPRRNAFRQPKLEAQLREGLARFGHVHTLFGWSLEEFTQDDEGVGYTLAGPGGATRIGRCSYFVGCDGAASRVRTQLGLVLGGQTFSERWLIIDLEKSPTPSRHTQVFCDAARPCIVLPGPGATRRFEFKLMPGEQPEQMLQPETVARLLAEHGADPAIAAIVRKTVYTFHARVADTWRRGRVLLAGDACHLTPPFAGQGMNSGIRDAHNLAWKLAAVLQGRLGPLLLKSYERERRGHVGEMIKLALRMGRIMAPRNRFAGYLTQALFRLLSAYPPARDYFAEMKYKPKPRFSKGFIVRDGRGARRTAVGRLLPQPTVLDANGKQIRLDEALGDGFALLAITQDPGLFERMTGHNIWQRLGARRLVIVREPVTYQGQVAVVQIAQPLMRDAISAHERIMLVRPDRYVAGSATLADADRFARAISSLCDETFGGHVARLTQASEPA